MHAVGPLCVVRHSLGGIDRHLQPRRLGDPQEPEPRNITSRLCPVRGGTAHSPQYAHALRRSPYIPSASNTAVKSIPGEDSRVSNSAFFARRPKIIDALSVWSEPT